MKKILITVCFFIVFVIAGSGSITSAQKEIKKAPDTILIGLIPERNIFEQIEHYEPLAAYLSEKTGMKIQIHVLARYGNIVNNFVELGLDGAFFGSFTYVLAHAKLGVEPIARPESNEGVSTYYGLIFVRKDSNIKSIKELKGKVFAFVDKATTAGYLLPLAFFRENGIDDYKTFFGETYFAGTHEDAIYDVLNKRADIGAAKNTIFYELAKENKRLTEELVVLARSPEVPSNALAVRKDLDASQKRKLQVALLGIHNDPKGIDVLKKLNARKFIMTRDNDYKPVYDYMKTINQDIAVYDYLNE